LAIYLKGELYLQLQNIRESKKMTQQEIANLAGVDISMISKIESGLRRPSVELAKKIAKVLDFDWTLFYREGD